MLLWDFLGGTAVTPDIGLLVFGLGLTQNGKACFLVWHIGLAPLPCSEHYTSSILDGSLSSFRFLYDLSFPSATLFFTSSPFCAWGKNSISIPPERMRRRENIRVTLQISHFHLLVLQRHISPHTLFYERNARVGDLARLKDGPFMQIPQGGGSEEGERGQTRWSFKIFAGYESWDAPAACSEEWNGQRLSLKTSAINKEESCVGPLLFSLG